MSEEMLIRHCSPTLAGMKTGNMFPCSYKSRNELNAAVRFWNQSLSGKDLRILPLRYDGNRALIYVYRPSKLFKDLQNETACRILRERGYGTETPERCIACLLKRMRDYDEFPHEIGLFLGYPPEDVNGFIENKANSCKCVGCWKVYGDEETAKKTFEKYKKCTRVYKEQYSNGKTLERLIVVN